MQPVQRFVLRAGAVAVLASPIASAYAADGPPPSSASYAEPSPTDSDPIPRLDLMIVGSNDSGNAIRRRVLSYFTSASTETHSTRLEVLDPSTVFAPTAFAGVRVWISVPTPTLARLLFAVQQRDGDPPRFLVTDVALVGGLDEVGQEKLAQVAYLSVQALWAGRLETPQKEVEEHLAQAWPLAAQRTKSKPKPQTSPAKPEAKWLDAGAEYVLRSRGAEGFSQGPGAVIGGAMPLGNFRLGARLHVGLSLGHTAERGELALGLAGGDVRAGFTPTWCVSKSVWITPEVGPGLDTVRYSPAFSDPAVAPREGRWDFRPFLYGGVELRWLLGDLGVTLGAFIAVQLQRTHYDVTTDNVRSEVLVPAIVQPGIALGVLW